MARYIVKPFDRLVNERHDELMDMFAGKDDEKFCEILQKNDAALKTEIGRLKAIYGKIYKAPAAERLRACELARDAAVYAEKLHELLKPDPKQSTIEG